MSQPDLPIVEALPALADALASHPTVLLEAPPGAGKSTYLPLWLLPVASSRQRIVLIQPRRLAADSVARFLARQLGEPLGRRIGLRTRFDNHTSADTVVEVVTEGIFLRQIQGDPTLEGVGHVLFDEYHERSWQADLGLAFALESQRDWREPGQPLRLIVMSATLPTEALSRWLGAPLVQASGRSYPVSIAYSPPGRREMLAHAADEIVRAVAGGSRKVLVFLPGWGAMQRLQRQLAGRLVADIELLHSQVPPAQQQRALAPVGERPMVVLATNIAETSLTIDGVDTVVDSGQVRRASYDLQRGMDRLDTGWISRASAEQRAGRAGRLGPGRCIRLWSSEQQGRLVAQDVAEIHRVDLAPPALELALWGSPAGELLPEPPAPARLDAARGVLRALEALDEGGHISALGRRLAGLGVHPRLGRLVLAGAEAGAPGTACELAALLSEGDLLKGGGSGVDLTLRLDALRQGGGGAPRGSLQRVRQLAQQLQRRVGGGPGVPGDTGELLLAAFPDRVARRRGERGGRYLAVDGFELIVDATDPLAAADWLVVAEHDGARQGARVRLAAAVAGSRVEAALAGRIETVIESGWDEQRQALGARRVRRLGAIELAAVTVALDESELANQWLALVRRHGLGWLQLSDAAEQWLARVRWAAAQGGDWPDLSDTALLARLDEWLAPWLGGVRRLDQLRGLNLLAALQSLLDHAARQRLEREVPARMQLPSGQQHTIHYRSDGPPLLSARLQEFYGLDRHPTAAGVPLLLELLSPAHRPLQLTADLPGFWRGSYQQVKKEMRGRYPKHLWADEPWNAVATTRTRRHTPGA
jgi:ATP-dependent helicase HrpB